MAGIPALTTIRKLTQLDDTPRPVSGDDGKVLSWSNAAQAFALTTGVPGPPSGAAGGVLSGSYPSPGFAADMATQAELDASALLAPLLAPATTARNTLTPTAVTVVPLTVKGMAGQNANLLEIKKSDNTFVAKIGVNHSVIYNNSADDSGLVLRARSGATGHLLQVFDSTTDLGGSGSLSEGLQRVLIMSNSGDLATGRRVTVSDPTTLASPIATQYMMGVYDDVGDNSSELVLRHSTGGAPNATSHDHLLCVDRNGDFMFQITEHGDLRWGPTGNATRAGLDTKLARSGIGALTLTGALTVTGALTSGRIDAVAAAATVALTAQAAAGQKVFVLKNSGGSEYFSINTATDTIQITAGNTDLNTSGNWFFTYANGASLTVRDNSGNTWAFAGANLTLPGAGNLVLGTGTGTKIGTAVGQKLGFLGATPTNPTTLGTLTQTYATADRTHAAFTSADLGAFTGGVIGFADAAERDNLRTQFNALRADVADLKQFVNAVVDDLQAYGLAA